MPQRRMCGTVRRNIVLRADLCSPCPKLVAVPGTRASNLASAVRSIGRLIRSRLDGREAGGAQTQAAAGRLVRCRRVIGVCRRNEAGRSLVLGRPVQMLALPERRAVSGLVSAGHSVHESISEIAPHLDWIE